MTSIKYKYICLFLLTLFTEFGFGQSESMDTIRLNSNNAATLNFNQDEEVLLCNIGGNPFKMVGEFVDYQYYQINIMSNIVLIETKRPKLQYSSIMVKTDKAIYYGVICNATDEEIKSSFYDFSRKVVANNNNASSSGRQSETESVVDDEVDLVYDNGVELFLNYNTEVTDEDIFDRLNKVINMDNEFEDIADMKGEVIFQVANIVNDHKFSYIKLIIQNNSSTTYKINGVFFRFQESKKNVGKKDAQNVEWINADRIKLPDNRSVGAYSYDVVGFVIPLYNGSTGNVMLKVIEDSGTRTAVLSIKSKTVNSCKVF